MTIKEALRTGHERLILTSPSARLDAELLLAHALGRPVTFLLAHDDAPLTFWQSWHYRRLIEKRRKSMPVAYLTGHKEFFALDFEVNRHVLIPRPDTEILVEAVIDYLRALKGGPAFLLDVGTGSGCIPVAVLKQFPSLRGMGVDISRSALKVAEKNRARHGLKTRLALLKSNLLASVKPTFFKGHELILTANLPYIPLPFPVQPELHYEPSISLYGGGDGLDVYKRLMDQVQTLCPRAIFLELFEFQCAILAARLPGYHLASVKPMSGQARVMILERD